jgi:Tfp pilus assembly protein PilX
MTRLTCRRHPLDEAGFALPSAVIVLFLVTVLSAAAIAVATQSSTSTTRDDNVKAEVEAAEAGLQVGRYRLAQLTPDEAHCINQSGEAIPLAGTKYCSGSGSESLGNGASFQYWTSLPLKTGDNCGGRPIVTETGVTQRCITAEGQSNGVEPAVRLQERVAAIGGEALFPVKGIVGLNKVLVNGGVKLAEVVASNGEITDGGKGSPHYNAGFELCLPKGKFIPPAGVERIKFGGTIGPTEKEKENGLK